MNFIAKIDEKMADTKYGWLDQNGQRHEKLNSFGEKYILQLPKQLQDSKLGVCWDQVELERKLFKDVGVQVRTFLSFITTVINALHIPSQSLNMMEKFIGTSIHGF